MEKYAFAYQTREYEFKKPFGCIKYNLMDITVNFQKNKPMVLTLFYSFSSIFFKTQT